MKKLLTITIIPIVLFFLTIFVIFTVVQIIGWQYRQNITQQSFNEQTISVSISEESEYEFVEIDNFKEIDLEIKISNKSTIRQDLNINVSLLNSDSELEFDSVISGSSEEIQNLPLELAYLAEYDQNPYPKVIIFRLENTNDINNNIIEYEFPIDLKLLENNELVQINSEYEFNKLSYNGNSEESELPQITFDLNLNNKSERKFESGFYEINLLDSEQDFVQQLKIAELSLIEDENQIVETFTFELPPLGFLEPGTRTYYIQYKYKGVVADRVVEVDFTELDSFEFTLESL